MRLRNTSYYLTVVIFFLFVGNNSMFAQNTAKTRALGLRIPEISILDIEPNIDVVNLNFIAPSEAGNPVTSSTDLNEKWLNYTSCITVGGASRNINVALDKTLTGVDIMLEVSTASGGGGVLGVAPLTSVVLTTTPVEIIGGIGGAFTGDGVGSGHQLIYSLGVNNYGLLSETLNEIIIVTYTISN